MKEKGIYPRIFKKLEEKKVIGGIAINLHGIQRATSDIDLMLAMDKENILKFVSLTKELGLSPKVPVKAEELANAEKLKEWREEKNMKVFSFRDIDNPYISIDIMTKNYLSFEKAFKKRIITEAWGVTVNVASINDLIKLKEIAGRPIDLADIEALKEFGKQ